MDGRLDMKGEDGTRVQFMSYRLARRLSVCLAGWLARPNLLALSAPVAAAVASSGAARTATSEVTSEEPLPELLALSRKTAPTTTTDWRCRTAICFCLSIPC